MDHDAVVGPLGDPPGTQTRSGLLLRLMQENGDLRCENERLRKACKELETEPVPPSTLHSLNVLIGAAATPEIKSEAEAAIVRLLRGMK